MTDQMFVPPPSNRCPFTELEFERLVYHLHQVGRAADLLSTPGQRYLREQLRYYGYAAPVLNDLRFVARSILDASLDENTLVASLCIARWQELLRKPMQKLLGAEEIILHARTGDLDRIVNEIEHTANVDDQAALKIEFATLSWANNRLVARERIREVEKSAKECQGKVIEKAALRLANVSPNDALRLARHISPSKRSGDAYWREPPSRARSIHQIFRHTGEVNRAQTDHLFADLETTEDHLHACTALAALAVKDSAVDACRYVERGVAHIRDKELRQDAKDTIARCFLLQAVVASPQSSVRALDAACRLSSLLVGGSQPVDFLDWRLVQAPDVWSTLAEDISVNACEFVHWRLSVLGYHTLDVPGDLHVPLVRDAVLSKQLSDRAAHDARGAADVGGDLSTLPGYLMAITDVANHLDGGTSREMECLLERATSFLCREEGAIAFYASFPVLQLACRLLSNQRQALLTWCLQQLDKMNGFSKTDGHLALGSILANEYVKAGDAGPQWLGQLLIEMPLEDHRERLALAVTDRLPTTACLDIAVSILEDGKAMGGHFPDQSILLAHTSVRLLARLAARLVGSYPRSATDILLRAAEFAPDVRFDVVSNSCWQPVLTVAMRIRPPIAWSVFRTCQCDPQILLFAIKDALDEQLTPYPDPVEQWARLSLDFIVARDQYNAKETGIDDRFSKGIDMRRSTHAPQLALYWEAPRRVDQQWIQELPLLFGSYVREYGDDKWVAAQLHKHAAQLAQLNWQTFMAVARDPNVGPTALHLINHSDLGVAVLKVDLEPSQLMKDVSKVRAVHDEVNGLTGRQDAFLNCLVALAAKYDAGLCVALVQAMEPQERAEFVSELERLIPDRGWTEEQIEAVLRSLAETSDTNSAFESQTAFLSWLSQHHMISMSSLDRLLQQMALCKDTEILYQAARKLKAEAPPVGLALAMRAIDTGLVLGGTGAIYKTLSFLLGGLHEESGGSKSECDSLVDPALAWWRSEASLKYRKLTQPMRAAEICTDLSKSHYTEQKQVLQALGEVIACRSDDDFRDCVNLLRTLRITDEQLQAAFLRPLISRAVAAGIIADTGALMMVGHTFERIRGLTAFSLASGRHEHRSYAVQEADNLTVSTARADAFVHIADAHLKLDRRFAFSLYTRALQEWRQQDNDTHFTAGLYHLADVCAEDPCTESRELSRDMQQAVDTYPFDSVRRSTPESKAYALILSALAEWPANKSEFLTRARSAATEAERRNDAYYGQLSHSVLTAYDRTLCVHGTDVALDLIKTVINVFSESSRRTFVDSLLGYLVEDVEASRPMAHYRIWRRAIRESRVPLVRLLLPDCSPQTAAQMELALAMTNWNTDPNTANLWIERAVNRSGSMQWQSDDFSYPSDLWKAYMLITDKGNWHRPMSRLLLDLEMESDLNKLNLESLIAIVAAKAADARSFLRSLAGAFVTLPVRP